MSRMTFPRVCFLLSLLCLPGLARAGDKATRVVVLPLKGSLQAPVLETLGELVVVGMSRLKYDVVTMEDINSQLQNQRAKDALGCSDIACAAELGGALDARFLMSGSARKLGTSLIVSLNLIDTTTQTTKRGQGRADYKDELFGQAVDAALREVMGVAPPAAAPPSGAPPTAGAGVVLSEDFADNKRGWKTKEDGDDISRIAEGRYFVGTGTGCYARTIALPTILPTNFDVEWTDVRIKGPPEKFYGLILGNDRDTYFGFGGYGDGDVAATWYVDDSKKADLIDPIAGIGLPANGKVENTHRVEVRDRYMTYFTNGKMVGRSMVRDGIDIRGSIIGFKACEGLTAFRALRVTAY